MALAKGRYSGFNHSHLTELLAEREGIPLSRSTVRRILLAGGIGSPRRRRAPKRYLRRERYPQEGMLLQIDGSRHNWLEGRGPHLTLIGAVDDATGTLPFALFRQETIAQPPNAPFDVIPSAARSLRRCAVVMRRFQPQGSSWGMRAFRFLTPLCSVRNYSWSVFSQDGAQSYAKVSVSRRTPTATC